MQDCRSFKGADIFNDHGLVISNISNNHEITTTSKLT